MKLVDPDDPRRATQEQTYVLGGDYLDECEGLCDTNLSPPYFQPHLNVIAMWQV